MAAKNGANGRDEEKEADGVGEEAGSEEDCAGDEDEDTIEDLLMGEAAFGRGLTKAGEGLRDSIVSSSTLGN